MTPSHGVMLAVLVGIFQCAAPPPRHVTLVATDASSPSDVHPASLLPLDQQAVQCLEAPSCSRAEMVRLFRAANDAKLTVACEVFSREGVAPDAREERACVEREVAKEDCSKDGVTLPRLAMAVMLADETPPSVAPARKLLEGCFRDVAVEDALAHVDARERDPRSKTFTSCDEYATTTMASIDCLVDHIAAEHDWLRVMRKRYASHLGDLFDAATKAHDDYATSAGAIWYERYAGGTLRDPAARGEWLRVTRRRRARLTDFPRVTPKPVDGLDGSVSVATIEARVEAERTRLVRAEPDLEKVVAQSAAAFERYRHAELAFYAAAPGAPPAQRVQTALALERLEDMVAASPR